MTAPVTIAVPGQPVPWKRAGRSNGFTYTPETQRQWMALWRDQAALSMQGAPPLTGPLKLTAVFWLPIPQSWSERKKQKAVIGLVLPDKRPDLSNYVKLVEDSLNQVVFVDDAQITDYAVKKRYGVAPQTVITVEAAAT